MSPVASPYLYAGCAVACMAWGILVLSTGRGVRAWPAAAACVITAFWAASVALSPHAPFAGAAGGLEVARACSWLGVLLILGNRVTARDGRALLRRFAVASGIAATLAAITLVPQIAAALTWPSVGSPVVLTRLFLVLMIVIVAENLYRNADDATRWHVVLPCVTLGGLAAFDLVLYAHAAISGDVSDSLLDARAVLTALVSPLLAVAAVRDRRWRRNPPVSRQVVFHGATLLIAGSFLLAVGAIGEALRHLGADWTRAAEISLWAGAAIAMVIAVTARSLRSRLRRTIVDHFFMARFDYRVEWLRCVTTLSEPDSPASTRAIRALADPVDSPAGVLLLRDPGEPEFTWAGSWNRPAEGISLSAEAPVVVRLRGGDEIAELQPGDLPELEAIFGAVWIAVPLLHHREGLLGIVLLAPPRAALALDNEVLDLLKSLGREVTMFLAERRSAERLSEQQHLHDHAQRFAFVAHDVKTVASQLTMLLANAEHHIHDPDFQRDMLLTVRASAKRINTLIARLRQPDAAAATSEPGIDALQRIKTIVHGQPHPARIFGEDVPLPSVVITTEAFDAAFRHLFNNAVEASPPGKTVEIRCRSGQRRLTVDIVDHGAGMTPEFIRDALFRPLETRKPNGTGVGAWQARELARRAGGDVTVLSRPGHGTTMRLTLPIAGAPAEAPPQPEAALQ